MDSTAVPDLQQPSQNKTMLKAQKLKALFEAEFAAPELELPWRRVMSFWSDQTVQKRVAFMLMHVCVLPLCNRYWIDINGGRKGFVLVKRGNEDDSSSSRDVVVRRVKWQEKSYDEFEKHAYRKFVLDSVDTAYYPAKCWRDWDKAASAPSYDMIGPLCRPADRLGAEVFNTFGGMAVDLEDARRNGDASDTGHGAVFQRFVEDGICALEGKVVGQRLYQWLACIATRPGWRSNVAVCLFGKGGAGRSTIANTMCRIMGDTLSASVSNPKVVLGDFNGVIKHKQFTVLEEVVLRDQPSMNRMKDLVDGHRLAVRNLFQEVCHFRNTNNYLICNNYPDSLLMDYDGVRKFFCVYTDDTCGFFSAEWKDQWKLLQQQLNYRDVLARMVKVADALPADFEVSADLPATKGMALQKEKNADRRPKDPVRDFLMALLVGHETIDGLQWGKPVPSSLLYKGFCSMYKESKKVMDVNSTQQLSSRLTALFGKLEHPLLRHTALVRDHGWQESHLFSIKKENHRCVMLPTIAEVERVLGVAVEPVADGVAARFASLELADPGERAAATQGEEETRAEGEPAAASPGGP